MTQYIYKPRNEMTYCPYCGNKISSIIKYNFNYPFIIFYCSKCRRHLPAQNVNYIEKG